MKSKSLGAGLPSEPEPVLAANEEFPGYADLEAASAPSPRGWDPYQVWRTRVKHPAEHAADPR